jgi:hypothetical protein
MKRWLLRYVETHPSLSLWMLGLFGAVVGLQLFADVYGGVFISPPYLPLAAGALTIAVLAPLDIALHARSKQQLFEHVREAFERGRRVGGDEVRGEWQNQVTSMYPAVPRPPPRWPATAAERARGASIYTGQLVGGRDLDTGFNNTLKALADSLGTPEDPEPPTQPMALG